MKLKGQLEQAQLENLASDPSNLPDGRIWLDTATDKAKFYDGVASRNIVTEDKAAALTNKTVVVASNTITTAASGNLAATELNAALAELDSAATAAQTAGDDAQFDINTHIADLANPHAVTKAQIGLSNVNDTSDATKNSATATLTNKTFGDAITLTEVATPSTPAAGLKKLYPKADGKMYTLDDAGIETEVGSGGGSGGINYIDNGDAETDTTGWATYADAAGSVPVDGTGGSPTLAFNRNTVSPLRGVASFLITKDAANRQGEGVSYDFTIAKADQAQMLQISAEIGVASGTYDSGTSTTNSDLIAYIYDVTNSRLIEPAGMKLQVGMKFKATFQSSSDSTSYRLIFHQSLTGTSAYVLQLDTVSVGPQVTASGYAGGDKQSYSMTPGSTTGMASYNAFVERVGDRAILTGSVLFNGTGGATGVSIPIPSGLQIDTAKMNDATVASFRNGCGSFFWYDDAGGNVSRLWARPDTTSSITLITGSNTTLWSQFANNDRLSWEISVPIVGWSSNTVASSEVSARDVVFSGYLAANTALTAGTTNVPYTTIKDSHGAWSGTVYTAKVPGDYFITITSQNSSGTGIYYVFNGAGSALKPLHLGSTTGAASGSTMLANLKAGDTFSIRSDSAVTIIGSATYTASTISIRGPAGKEQITATESVRARYTSVAGNSVGTSATLMSFATMTYDTHGRYASGLYTVGVAGKYRAGTKLTTASVTISTTQLAIVYLYKNGSLYSALGATRGNGVGNTVHVGGFDEVDCVVGDTLAIYASCDVATSLNTAAGFNFVSFERVGN